MRYTRSRRSEPPALLMALVLMGAWGCGTSDKIIGRYRTALCETEGSPSAVSCTSMIPKASAYVASIKTPPISASASETAPPDSTSVPHACPPAKPKISATAHTLQGNLGESIGPTPTQAAEESRTVFHRTLIVTVRKDGDFNPADRLEATDVTIEPDHARFDSWDTLKTDYTTINAGTLQLTQTREATENLSAGAPAVAPMSASGSVGGSQTNTRTESLTATVQAETLSATVEKDGKALVIHRQGGPGVDLTGNTIIKVVMSYSGNPMATYVFSVANHTDEKGKNLPPKKLRLSELPVFAVPPNTSVSATVTLVYTLRHIKSGDTTYEEKDDDVVEITSKPVIRNVVLIPKREFSPPMFGLVNTRGNARDYAVSIERPGRRIVGLCFDHYNEALDFLAYLRTSDTDNPGAVSDARLGFVIPHKPDLVTLKPQDLKSLEVEPKCL